jgi:hypothetical protein
MKYGMEKPMTQIARRAAAKPHLVTLAVRAAVCAGALALIGGTALAAGPNPDQATRIYNRIAGVPPTAQQLSQMTGAADPVTAAIVATNDPAFYNDTIRNMAAPWTNRDQSVFVPLNDYTATVIGMVRDNVAFNTLLSADLVYIGDGKSGEPAYSASNNAMYDALDANNVDLSAHLVSSTQSSLEGIPTTATAGVMTTRGGASAFFINGTNRAMFRFTMMNHLCHDMEQVMDTTRPSDRIRQDVARSPGGDSRIFMNQCAGCHSGMDPMAQAFAYYNYDGVTTMALQYTPNQVQPKYTINATNFPYGFVTPDNTWSNRWRAGPNSFLGFDPSLPGSGVGAKSLGQELAASDWFAQCQVQKVFQTVCFRAPNSSTDMATVATIKANFKSGGYKLKQVFEQSAAACAGQ